VKFPPPLSFQAFVGGMSLTSPVLTSSQTSHDSRPPLLATLPTLQRPFGVQVSRKSRLTRR
jgi:hypothetical protein